MSEQTDNTRPPQPPRRPGDDGQRTVNAAPTDMVAFSNGARVIKPLSFGAAVAWCVAAGVCAGISPIMSSLFVGFAYALMAGNGGMRERLIAVACTVVPAVLCVFALRFAGYEDAVFSCIVGIVGSHLYLRGKLTPGVACIAVALLSALLLGVSEAIARLAGTSLAAQFALIMDMYMETFEAASIEMSAALVQMRTIVDAIWPTAFVIIAFVEFALSIIGAKVGAGRQGVDVGTRETIEQFDLPLWMVGCLIGAILILSASRAVPSHTNLLMMVGGTLLCSLRLAFATQGFAVLTWFKHSKGLYGLVGIIITVVMLFLEINMFVLTIVGVLDVWMNMRHLTRGVRVTVQDPADRS